MNAKQEAFTRSLLTGATIRRAALESSISERQAHRWMSNDAFRTELSKRQSQLTDELNTRLLAGAQEAVELLRALIQDDKCNVAVRRLAASSLIDAYFKHTDIYDFELRLSELERHAWPVK